VILLELTEETDRPEDDSAFCPEEDVTLFLPNNCTQ
jgi:hypothetical protein